MYNLMLFDEFGDQGLWTGGLSIILRQKILKATLAEHENELAVLVQAQPGHSMRYESHPVAATIDLIDFALNYGSYTIWFDPDDYGELDHNKVNNPQTFVVVTPADQYIGAWFPGWEILANFTARHEMQVVSHASRFGFEFSLVKR